MSTDPRFGPRSGLSLLELLVSLALLALIAGGLAGAFGIGAQVFDRARGLDTAQSEIAARRQLRSALMQALPSNRITPFPNSFIGAPDRMEFLTLGDAPFGRDAAGLRVSVRWSGAALSMDVAPFDDTGQAVETWTYALSADVQNVTFGYLDTSGDTPQWLPNWEDQAGLPALIRITGNGGTPEWVEFIVAPRL